MSSLKEIHNFCCDLFLFFLRSLSLYYRSLQIQPPEFLNLKTVSCAVPPFAPLPQYKRTTNHKRNVPVESAVNSATCFATLLKYELKSDIAHFTTNKSTLSSNSCKKLRSFSLIFLSLSPPSRHKRRFREPKTQVLKNDLRQSRDC